MDAMIQPIDTAAFQGPAQRTEGSSAALNPFSQVLKEKAQTQKSPENEEDKSPPKGVNATGLQEFWLYWFSPKGAAMPEEEVEVIPENQVLGIKDYFAGGPGSAMGNEEDCTATQPELKASLDLEGLSASMEPKAPGLPLENAKGFPKGPPLSPETTSLSNQKGILAQEKKPVPSAPVEAQGQGFKEQGQSFINYLLTPHWDAEAQFLSFRLAPLDRENDLPALIRPNFPTSNFETERPLVSGPRDPFLPLPGKSSNDLSGLKPVDSGDPILASEPMTAPSLTSHGPWPGAGGGAVRLSRPISSLEALHLMNRIGERMVWSARNNGEIIRLNLQPPELGNLAIKIEKENDQVKATLLADNFLVKDILETHQSYLQRSLERDGFKLAQYDVFVQKDMESFEQFEEQFAFQEGVNRKRIPSPPRDPDSALLQETQERIRPGRPGSGNIDRWV